RCSTTPTSTERRFCPTIHSAAPRSPAVRFAFRKAPALARHRRRASIWLRHSKVRERESRFVEIALPLPLFQTFTYAVEEGLANPVVVGSRVVVPLRSGKEVGVCVGVSDASPLKRKPKAVLESPDARPAVDALLLEL